MAGETTYGLGGLIPAHPSKNKLEEWDLSGGTYTKWDAAGTVITQRSLTPGEVSRYTPRVEETNETTLRERADAAVAQNNTYLAIVTPTNPQVAAQVRLLTRECSALIRLLLNKLDASD